MSKASWYKGNIHTHTSKSDGDTEPARVVSWYRRHGYDFLVLSDHNHLTLLEYGEGRRRLRRPLMVPGEEVSANIKNGSVPIHLGGIGISRVVEPIDSGDVVSTIQANVDAILQAGGIAAINHPNFRWAFDHEAIKQVTGASLLEVYNGHPLTNVYGAPGKPDYDEIWDAVLSSGRVIFGVATDDSHRFRDFDSNLSNPGRGWVVVRSIELSKEAIVDSLASGDFYSSTGVALAELDVAPDIVRLRIEQQMDLLYGTRFIGKDGVVLAEVAGLEAEYRIEGDEGYVRAVVVSSGNARAWTQPVFTDGYC